ncbi:hypothetical protein ColLi_02958 [Colletotrichum liriopes]|uniref:Uncharacterized protein n=1 Tax=Colletotrichum liriopes TaxID=708192 RepID=A0AA37GFT9_9PEZI|nr:hypothetical protein ColLi_02958 [Colletotrichum liriopes]
MGTRREETPSRGWEGRQNGQKRYLVQEAHQTRLPSPFVITRNTAKVGSANGPRIRRVPGSPSIAGVGLFRAGNLQYGGYGEDNAY